MTPFKGGGGLCSSLGVSTCLAGRGEGTFSDRDSLHGAGGGGGHRKFVRDRGGAAGPQGPGGALCIRGGGGGLLTPAVVAPLCCCCIDLAVSAWAPYSNSSNRRFRSRCLSVSAASMMLMAVERLIIVCVGSGADGLHLFPLVFLKSKLQPCVSVCVCVVGGGGAPLGHEGWEEAGWKGSRWLLLLVLLLSLCRPSP